MRRIVLGFKQNLEYAQKSKNTVVTYCSVADKFCDFIEGNCITVDESISGLNGDVVKKWIGTMAKHKDTTRNLYVIATRSFLRDIFTSGKIDADYSIALPKVHIRQSGDDVFLEDGDTPPETEKVVYAPKEIAAMTDACPNTPNGMRTKALIALLLGSGMRASEIASLNVSEYVRMLTLNSVKCVRKGGYTKRIAIAGYAKKCVGDYLELRGDVCGDDPLFVTSNNRRMDRREIWGRLATVQRKCGVKTGVHNFRHTVVSGTEKVGGVSVARDIASHTSLKVTNRYLHTTDEERLSALEHAPWAGIIADQALKTPRK